MFLSYIYIFEKILVKNSQIKLTFKWVVVLVRD